jgi:hypothetical protein
MELYMHGTQRCLWFILTAYTALTHSFLFPSDSERSFVDGGRPPDHARRDVIDGKPLRSLAQRDLHPDVSAKLSG